MVRKVKEGLKAEGLRLVMDELDAADEMAGEAKTRLGGRPKVGDTVLITKACDEDAAQHIAHACPWSEAAAVAAPVGRPPDGRRPLTRSARTQAAPAAYGVRPAARARGNRAAQPSPRFLWTAEQHAPLRRQT